MKIIVSPTKQMKISDKVPMQAPHFVQESRKICEKLKKLNTEELCTLMKIKDKIAEENRQRYTQLSFSMEGTPALYTYSGLQFHYMNVEEFTQEDIAYVKEHIRILSGLYGILRPLDAIQPYRLEMQAKLKIEDAKDLYTFWGNRLANYLIEEEQETPCIINLASKEYAKAVQPYIKEDMYTITFYMEKDGKLKTESTQVKMARGRMVHWMVKHHIQTIEQLTFFDEDGYVFHKELSSENELVFVKKK